VAVIACRDNASWRDSLTLYRNLFQIRHRIANEILYPLIAAEVHVRDRAAFPNSHGGKRTVSDTLCPQALATSVPVKVRSAGSSTYAGAHNEKGGNP
jgi:hypothetical protein